MQPDLKIERTLRRLLRILDLSRDLERNLSDSKFRNSGGEIQYVFDENIFELFVRPWRHADEVETFYGDLWLPRDGSADRAEWAQLEAQSGIIASEYLIEAKLPGAVGERILLSEHHRWELARRVIDLAQSFKEAVDKSPETLPNRLLQKLESLHGLWGAQTGGREPLRSDRQILGLTADIEGLRASDASADVLYRFRVTRTAADALASDRIIEPIEQLRRLVAPENRDRLGLLQELYCPSQTEYTHLEAQAKLWYRAIIAELAQPGHLKRVREDRAIWNDAQTIAHVRWAANKAASKDKRLVFITGDPVLFDAYRRWYAKSEPGKAEWFEPFFMRRTTQYAPIFNFTDAGTDAKDRGEASDNDQKTLSALLHEGLEGALLALSISNFGHSGGGSQDAVVARARERLALKLVDRQTLSDDGDLRKLLELMTPVWLEQYDERIRTIRSRWQAAQRAAIGSALRLVSKRLNPEELALAKMVAERGENAAQPALQKYIGTLLHDAIDGSLNFSLPLASGLILSQSPKTGERPRVPLTMDLSLPGGATLSGVVEAWWLGHEGAKNLSDLLSALANPELSHRRTLAFAVAAALALASQDANEAERFADVAVRSADSGPKMDADSRNLEVELTFLHALTLRFQMAAIGPLVTDVKQSRKEATSTARQTIKLIRRSHRRATKVMERHIEQLHAAKGTMTEERYVLLTIRSLSERAGLGLFMATAILVAQRLGVYDESFSEAGGLVDRSKKQIISCLQLESRILTDENVLLNRIRRQYVPNIAAAETLAFLLPRVGEYNFDDQLRPYEDQVERFVDNINKPPPLLIAECLAFKVLSGKGPRDAARHFLNVKRSGAESLKLPMDKALLEAIISKFS